MRGALYGLLGKDWAQIHGMGPYLALTLVAERGNDPAVRPPSGGLIRAALVETTLEPGSIAGRLCGFPAKSIRAGDVSIGTGCVKTPVFRAMRRASTGHPGWHLHAAYDIS